MSCLDSLCNHCSDVDTAEGASCYPKVVPAGNQVYFTLKGPISLCHHQQVSGCFLWMLYLLHLLRKVAAPRFSPLGWFGWCQLQAEVENAACSPFWQGIQSCCSAVLPSR